MKTKILKFSIIVAILGVALWSCNKEDIAPSENPTSNNSTLFLNLENYNNEFLSTHNNPSRGFWSSLGYFAQVASADLIGAGTTIWATSEIIAATGITTGPIGAGIATGVAGVIGAGGASYAASGNPPSDNGGNYNENQGLHLQLPISFSIENDMGGIHNSYLKSVIYGNTSQNDWISTNFPTERSNIQNILSNSEVSTIITTIENKSLDYKNNGYDYETLISDYETLNYLSSNVAQVLQSFMSVYSQSENFDDIKNTVDFYTLEILNSSLTTLEKKSLFGSFSVALKSPMFWNS